MNTEALADTLANSMDFFDETEFSEYAKELGCINSEEIFNKYWALSPYDRSEITFDWVNWVEENAEFEETNGMHNNKNQVYVKFLDCKNRFKETTKDFETYEMAWAWVVENFEKPSHDFIHYY